jgi:hypothetical protein
MDAPCPICLDVARAPTWTSCGHCFCRSCLASAQQYSDVCPVCRTNLHTRRRKRTEAETLSRRVRARQQQEDDDATLALIISLTQDDDTAALAFYSSV